MGVFRPVILKFCRKILHLMPEAANARAKNGAKTTERRRTSAVMKKAGRFPAPPLGVDQWEIAPIPLKIKGLGM
jgi:hypothetical protein